MFNKGEIFAIGQFEIQNFKWGFGMNCKIGFWADLYTGGQRENYGKLEEEGWVLGKLARIEKYGDIE